jgi:glutathione S-transferase
MITLFYSPQSRASSLIGLLQTMGKLDEVTVKTVHIQRENGTGHIDPANPHPEGKVPFLQTENGFVRERAAIVIWLTDHFSSDMGRGQDHPSRGQYLSWLVYANSVLEAALMMKFLGQEDNPQVLAWCRKWDDVTLAINAALEDKDYIVDDEFSAADIVVASVFGWIPTMDRPGKIAAWVDRVMAKMDLDFVENYDAKAMLDLGLK